MKMKTTPALSVLAASVEATARRRNYPALLPAVCLLAIVGCQTIHMAPYPQFIDLFPLHAGVLPPVILVGRILSSVPVGSKKTSQWDGETPYQQYRCTVAVENVLRGDVNVDRAEIYFLVNMRSQGHARLGVLSNSNGSWRIGDREMFFLQQDSGHLRTVCDTFAHCVAPVLSGFHSQTQNGSRTEEDIADILLTRGKGSSDQQMVDGMERATFFSFSFDAPYSMKKLEQLTETGSESVIREACKYLQIYSHPYSDPSYSKALETDPGFVKAISACRITSIGAGK